jgi:hypothetical protein
LPIWAYQWSPRLRKTAQRVKADLDQMPERRQDRQLRLTGVRRRTPAPSGTEAVT